LIQNDLRIFPSSQKWSLVTQSCNPVSVALSFLGQTTEKPHPKQKAGKQPLCRKVGENLYRLESSGGYYALAKKGGKQFRKSLKTKDRKLAERRVQDFKERIGLLKVSSEAKLAFKDIAGAGIFCGNRSLKRKNQNPLPPAGGSIYLSSGGSI